MAMDGDRAVALRFPAAAARDGKPGPTPEPRAPYLHPHLARPQDVHGPWDGITTGCFALLCRHQFACMPPNTNRARAGHKAGLIGIDNYCTNDWSVYV